MQKYLLYNNENELISIKYVKDSINFYFLINPLHIIENKYTRIYGIIQIIVATILFYLVDDDIRYSYVFITIFNLIISLKYNKIKEKYLLKNNYILEEFNVKKNS